MLPEEHYFENLLHAFKDDGIEGLKNCRENDKNRDYLTQREINIIETCAEYIIFNCCNNKQSNLKKLFKLF